MRGPAFGLLQLGRSDLETWADLIGRRYDRDEELPTLAGRRPRAVPDRSDDRPWEAPPVRDPFDWTPDELAEATRLAREMLGVGSA